MKKKLAIFLSGFVAVLAAVVFIKTSVFSSRQLSPEPAARVFKGTDAAAERLGGAVRFKTISYQDAARVDFKEFEAFRQYLIESFPLVHASLEREIVGGHSLLYKWKGKDPGLEPVIFMAHQDVVPIASGTEKDWTQPPFSGVIADGYIWGRGTLDDKGSLMGIMEAAEWLLSRGFRPERDFYLAFGHDEEIGGRAGAAEIVKLLQKRGVRAFMALDESGAITEGMVPGVKSPVSLIGVAEKGYMTVRLSVEAEGGHSSMPPRQTAIGILAAAITKLEENPFPKRADHSMLLLDFVGPEMPYGMKMVMANRWLFKPLIVSQLSASKATDASLHTTTAVTIIHAGEKENVLPPKAEAVVNFRLLPGDRIDYVMDRVNKVIGDPRVKVTMGDHPPSEASAMSDVNSPAFEKLAVTIKEVFPETIVAPYLVMAATDARHYCPICDNVLRYLPSRLTGEDLKRIHGTNERIAADNYGETVNFYIRMMMNAAK